MSAFGYDPIHIKQSSLNGVAFIREKQLFFSALRVFSGSFTCRTSQDGSHLLNAGSARRCSSESEVRWSEKNPITLLRTHNSELQTVPAPNSQPHAHHWQGIALRAALLSQGKISTTVINIKKPCARKKLILLRLSGEHTQAGIFRFAESIPLEGC